MDSSSRRAPRLVALALVLGYAAPAPADSVALANAKKCQKTMSKQARAYAQKREATLLKCVDRLLKCEILLEVDGVNPNTCRTSATDACTKAIGPAPDSKTSKLATAFDTKVGLACLPFGVTAMLSTASGGLWFGNDPDCGTAVDVPSLVACVRDALDERTEAIVGEVKPRAGLLLDNAGLGAGYPDIPRPPQLTVVVSATAPSSGTLVSPGTITLAAGTSLRIEGDPTTLPCGGPGMNGKLTVTVGSGPTAQERVLKENYSGQFALFGPFTVAGSIPYTIKLKDGPCDDTVSGSVVVP